MKFRTANCIILGLLVILSPLSVAGFRLNSITYPVLWALFPILVYQIMPSRKSRRRHILIIIGSTLYVCLSVVPVLQFALCGYGPKKDEYTSKKNPNLKLVGRDFSCFGTIGDLVLYKEYSITKNLKLEFRYKSFYEYQNISVDTAEWKRIE